MYRFEIVELWTHILGSRLLADEGLDLGPGPIVLAANQTSQVAIYTTERSSNVASSWLGSGSSKPSCDMVGFKCDLIQEVDERKV